MRQLKRGGAIGLAAGLVVAVISLLSLHPTVLPVALQGYVPRWEQATLATAPQQAALVRPSLGEPSEPTITTAPAAAPGEKLLDELNAAPTAAAETAEEKVEMPTVVLKTAPVTPVASAPVATKKEAAVPVAVATPVAPVVAAVKPAASKPVVSVKDSKAVVVAAKPAAPAAAKVAVTTTGAAKTTAATGSTIKARTGRFYIVVGAYTSLAGAQRGRHNVVKAGRPAPQTKIILPFPGTNKYRISAADFASYGEALAAAAQLRQNPHLDKGLSVFPY